MATPLTLWGQNLHAVTVPSALQLTTTGGASTTGSSTTKLGTATGWGEIAFAGNSGAWAAGGAASDPSGLGFLYDSAILEGQQFLAGSWTPTVRVQAQLTGGGAVTVGTVVATLMLRVYIRHASGVYTLLGQATLAGQQLKSFTNYTFPSIALPVTPLNAGDRLYYDLVANITVNTTGDSGTAIRVGDLGNGGLGGNNEKLITPGYEVQPPIISRTGGITVVLADQDITSYVDESSIDMTLTLGQGPGVASGGAARTSQMVFMSRLGPVPTAKGAGEGPFSGTDLVRMGELDIYDVNNQKVFGGFVVDLEDATTTLEVQTQITATDFWQFLDRIMVNEVFAGQSDTEIITYLLTKYAPWVDQSLLPTTNQYVFTKRYFRARTLRDTLQVVADVTGYNIWIDANKVIHYASLGSLSTAPFSVSDDPDYIATFPHQVTKYVQDDTSIINRVYFYGGRNLSDDYVQDLSVQANGNNTGFAILYYPHEASDGSVHVTKNGTDLVEYSALDTDPSHALIRDGGTAEVLVNYDAETLEFNTAPLAADTLTMTYRYEKPLVMVLSSTKSFQKFGEWFEAKIVDENVYDSQTALQRSRVLLSEQSDGLTSVQLKTWRAGLQPGMLLYIRNTVRGIDATYQVQKVEMKPMMGGFFEWTVDLGAWTWNLVDTLIWQGRAADATDDSLQESESVIQAKEALLASTVTVALTSQVRTSGAYYSRTSAVGDGHDAYSGFFSVTS